MNFVPGRSHSTRGEIKWHRTRATVASYSRSMVPGGQLVMSSVTRLTTRTSLLIRVEMLAKRRTVAARSQRSFAAAAVTAAAFSVTHRVRRPSVMLSTRTTTFRPQGRDQYRR